MCNVFDVLIDDDCGSNMGGTKLKLHYTGWNDILTFGAKGAGTKPEDEFIITTPHIFKTGKSFKTINITKNTGVNNITPGGNNSGAKVNNFVFRIPSKNMAALALFNSMANGIYPLLFLVEDANMPDGTYDQIGDNKFYATMTAQKLNGESSGEGSMYEFTVDCVQPARKLYTATVALTPAA